MTGNVEPSGIEFIKFPRLWGESRAVKVGHFNKVSIVTVQVFISCETTSQVAIGVSGKEFATIREHMPEHHKKLILGATVFARMGPDQKAQLIEDLQDVVCRQAVRIYSFC